MARFGKITLYCAPIAKLLKSHWRCCGFYRQTYEEEEEEEDLNISLNISKIYILTKPNS
jgi:hypothetical protein